MDEPQVDALDPERGKALLERRPLAPCATLRQLRRQEDLLARQPALRHCLPDLCFVAVHRRRVDVPVADLERAAHGVDRAAAARLPGAEPEQGHPRPRCELDALVRDRLLAHVVILLISGHLTRPLGCLT